MSGHTRSRVRGAAAACFGALLFAALLVAAYARRPGLVLAVDSDLPAAARGFYPFEHNANIVYAWTGPHAELPVAGIDRRVPWQWSSRVMLWRPPGTPPPTLRVAIDGVVAFDRTIARDGDQIVVTVPVRPEKTGVTITLETSPTFVPSPADARQLGVALSEMSLAPERGTPWPPRQALAGGAIAVLAIGLAFAWLPVPPLWVLGGATLAAIGETWALLRGSAVYASYPVRTGILALAIAAGTWLVVWLVDRIRREPLSVTARGVAACSALAAYLKLLILLHPGMPIGDGVFHAHRFELVLGGHFYFTSIAPGNYSFPYPILLYVIAAPFSHFAPDTMSRLALLRIVVTVADAVAGALLYWMIVRATADRAAGFGAVVWYHLVPMTAWIMTWGNLTNAFGQPLFVASLAAIVALPVDATRPRTVALLAAIAAAALLSHPSTCAILAIVLGVTTMLYALQGAGDLRGAAIGVGIATILAGVAAVLLYYAWFPAVYARELTRVAAESGTQLSTAAPDWTMSRRIAAVPDLAGSYLGWPALAAAAIGAWRLRAAGSSPRLQWLLVGWGGACLVFLLLGIVTPVQMRTHFAAFPAVAVAAACGTAWAWRGRLPLRVCAVVLVSAAAWLGLQQWMGMLG